MNEFFDIHAEIAELRAEITECILTSKERVEANLRLDDLLKDIDRRRREEKGA